MALQTALLEESFQQIAPRGLEFVGAFYDRLFELHPETRELFGNVSMLAQKHKLLASLVLVIENLNKPDVLTSALQRLGAKHTGYGVFSEHYPMVGGALLDTFAEFLGEQWTPEVREAWTEAYGAITSIMQQGTVEAA
jgi:nitric oxide dioxygenase